MTTPSSVSSHPGLPGAKLAALLLCLVVAGVLAAYLGGSHVLLTHGTGAFDSLCGFQGALDCDAVNTSEWSELFGRPISLWALPTYAILGLWIWVGRAAGERSRRALSGALALATWNLLVSLALLGWMLVELQTLCLLCLGLDLAHLVIWALLWSHTPARRPALPTGLELISALVLSVTVMGFAFQLAWIAGDKLDRDALQEVMAEPAQAVLVIDPLFEEREGRVLSLPAPSGGVVVGPGDAAHGPPGAVVTVVEFADFQCAYCRKLSHSISELKEGYGDRVRFVFKHYPMDQSCNPHVKGPRHEHACAASVAAWCAQQQGAFWRFHDRLFQNQDHLAPDDLRRHAAALGLDSAAFDACVQGPAAGEAILADVEQATALGITGTPRTYVNGRLFKGAVSTAMLEAAIQLELGEADTTADGRVRTTRRVLAEPGLADGPQPMVHIADGGFWIDAVEASMDSQGRAVSWAGQAPATLTWAAAGQACARAGKRLCTPTEWLHACQGGPPVDDDGSGSVLDDYLEGREFPYGTVHQAGFCHDDSDRSQDGPAPTGSHGACRSPEGVHDLAGNVQEWVGADTGQAVLLGGAWFSGGTAGCHTVFDSFGPGLANESTGFRCCADSAVAAPPEAAVVPAPASEAIPAAKIPKGFAGKGLDGLPIDAGALLQGKVGVINFWATWCAPCQKELPALADLYTRLARLGLELIAVNVDREPARVGNMAARLALPFPVLLDPESHLAGQFGVLAMPTTVVVDRSGRVVETHSGFNEAWVAQLEAQLRGLLAAPSP